jgi:hypothetical protein
MNFVLLVHLHHAAYAGNVYERARAYSAGYQADCWSVITLARKSCQHQGVPHEFCTLLVHCVTPACTGYVDDRTLWRHSRDSMLTAGL